MQFSRLSTALAASLLAMSAQAQVSVKDAWVRATVPQQQATGAFMQLQAVQDSKLVSASSPLTPHVEVHEMSMQGDVMKMRQVPNIALPAGRSQGRSGPAGRQDRQGQRRRLGAIPMPPNARVSEVDAQKLAAWVLSVK